MPLRQIKGTDIPYYLIAFDEDGNERREDDGSLMSETIRSRVADSAPPVTDVFFASHGWKGAIPDAIDQYDRWMGAVAKLDDDRARARTVRQGFTPLIIGLHWPSLPWGDEKLPPPGGGLLSGGDGESFETQAPVDRVVDVYAKRIAGTTAARDAIRTIVQAARADGGTAELSPDVEKAYQTLFAESGLAGNRLSGAPGSDVDGFDPKAIVKEATRAAKPSGGPAAGGNQPVVLGGGFFSNLKDTVLSPLRQLSFWKMKDRARKFGETGAHSLLVDLQKAAPPTTRFHLMGHSFGCIVASAAVAGPPNGPPLVRPVDSLLLVQGALSIWAYATGNPYEKNAAGYFSRIVSQGLVRGPIVTTRSSHDSAVGKFYPMGAELKKQVLLGNEPRPKFPKYGGIGAFGIQGLEQNVEDLEMQPSTTHQYRFQPGRVYNLESSGIIKDGGGASGAHSDISHPEVAHVFWETVLAGA